MVKNVLVVSLNVLSNVVKVAIVPVLAKAVRQFVLIKLPVVAREMAVEFFVRKGENAHAAVKTA